MGKRGPKPGSPYVWTDERLEELADEMVAFYEANPDSCFLEDFTSANGLWRQRISEWEKKCPKLADARKRVDEITASRVALLGLKGGANPTFAIFALKQKGWSDTQKVEHSGGFSVNLSYEVVTEAQDH